MAEFECFQYGSFTRGQEVIRGEHHTSICLRLHITSAFQWYDADLLLLQVRFGTTEALLPRRIFKPVDDEELEIDLVKWKVWNRETYEWREAEFQFCELEVSEYLAVTLSSSPTSIMQALGYLKSGSMLINELVCRRNGSTMVGS